MPLLDDPRHELFAQAIARGEMQGRAYVEAGFEATTKQSISTGASKLALKSHISARVAEIQELAARKAERKIAIKKADILQMLLEDRESARARNQFGPAVRATELLGKQMGMFADRQQIEVGPLDDMSVTELAEMYEQINTIARTTGGAERSTIEGDAGAEAGDAVSGDGTALDPKLPEAL
ncbi:hypothetical protein [Bradyrhizobium sp. dw_78]|uniref:hypothetical protein n=1 Tax=Bradyrhizobium sp. dw_78 TaxID=2719793 RepID=UPI00201C758B|nr:hypothetical protein [Bradyrhizobium sp. dw_78]